MKETKAKEKAIGVLKRVLNGDLIIRGFGFFHDGDWIPDKDKDYWKLERTADMMRERLLSEIEKEFEEEV